jgi:hypothetical protein
MFTLAQVRALRVLHRELGGRRGHGDLALDVADLAEHSVFLGAVLLGRELAVHQLLERIGLLGAQRLDLSSASSGAATCTRPAGHGCRLRSNGFRALLGAGCFGGPLLLGSAAGVGGFGLRRRGRRRPCHHRSPVSPSAVVAVVCGSGPDRCRRPGQFLARDRAQRRFVFGGSARAARSCSLSPARSSFSIGMCSPWVGGSSLMG